MPPSYEKAIKDGNGSPAYTARSRAPENNHSGGILLRTFGRKVYGIDLNEGSFKWRQTLPETNEESKDIISIQNLNHHILCYEWFE